MIKSKHYSAIKYAMAEKLSKNPMKAYKKAANKEIRRNKRAHIAEAI